MDVENLLSIGMQEKLRTKGIEKFLDSLGDERLKQKKSRMGSLFLLIDIQRKK